MKIGIATDHGGFALKQEVMAYLQKEGYDIHDFGAKEYDGQDDFPDLVIPLARAVGDGRIDRGIAICGSGVGACITANKIKKVRAALITESYSARQGVEHDDLNLICLGGRVIGIELAKELLNNFLKATYIGEERHQRRLDKIAELE